VARFLDAAEREDVFTTGAWYWAAGPGSGRSGPRFTFAGLLMRFRTRRGSGFDSPRRSSHRASAL
jgi:hypothetical protein